MLAATTAINSAALASSNARLVTSNRSSHSGSGYTTSSSQSTTGTRASIPSRPSLPSSRSGSFTHIQSQGSVSSSRRRSVAASTPSTHGTPPGPADRRPSLASRRASTTSAVATSFDTLPITLDADVLSDVRLCKMTAKEAEHYAEFTSGNRTFGYEPDYLARARELAGVPSKFMVDFVVKTEAGSLARSIRLSECGSTQNVEPNDLISYLSRVMGALDDSQPVLPLPGVYFLYIKFPFGLGKPHAVNAKFNLNWTWADPQATIKEGYLTEIHKNTLPRGRYFSYKALVEAPRRAGKAFSRYVPWDDLAEPAGLPAAARGLDSRANILAYLGTTNQIGNYY